MTIHEWSMIAIVVFAIVLGLIRLNPTFTIGLLFCIAFTFWIVLSQGQNWSVPTVPSLGVVTGLILIGIYYLVRRFSPWRKAVANPPA